jgi:hypothetical protein
MARRKTLLDLIDELTPAVRRAFLESVQIRLGEVSARDLEDAIQRRDEAAIYQMLAMRSEFFAPLDKAMREGYEQAGEQVMAELQRMAQRQGVRVTGMFGGNDPAVARWLMEQSSRRVREITEDERAVLQDVLSRLYEQGTAPRTMALELMGRKNLSTGRREGGVVGLTEYQARQAEDAFDALTTDPRIYFIKDRGTGKWKPRWKSTDRRFDRAVLKAIREKTTVPVDLARKIKSHHRARLLYARGEAIARTELRSATGAAEYEAMEQMRRREGLPPSAITLEWDAAGDGDTRMSHRLTDGQTRKQGEPFQTGDGNFARFPGDPNLPASDRIRCRCYLRKRIDFITGLRDRLSEEERRAVLEAM